MYVSYDKLPKATRLKLLEIQNNNSLIGVAKFNASSRIFAFLGIIVAISGLYYIFSQINNFLWIESDKFWFFIFSVISTTSGWFGLNYLFKFYSNVLKEFTYINPVWYIEVSFIDVYFFPLWNLKDLKVVHNYKNSSYQNTTITFIFSNMTRHVSTSSKENAQKLYNLLKEYHERVAGAFRTGNIQQLREDDIFYEYRTEIKKTEESEILTKPQPKNHTLELILKWAVAPALGIVFFVFAKHFNTSFAKPYLSNNQKSSEHPTATPTNPLQEKSTTLLAAQANQSRRKKTQELIQQLNKNQEPLNPVRLAIGSEPLGSGILRT